MLQVTTAAVTTLKTSAAMVALTKAAAVVELPAEVRGRCAANRYALLDYHT
jgi:hypothetical protein